MKNKHGVQFLCMLPDQVEIEEATKPKKPEPVTNEAVVTALAVNRGMKNLYGGSYPRQDCFYLHPEGEWWSYEVCINEEIRQFHLPAGSSQLVSVSSLGRFAENQDWEKEENEQDEYDQFLRPKQHMQVYDQGTICDITNTPRTSRVYFRCIDSSQPTQILSIQESATCTYEINMHLQHLCSIPQLSNEEQSKKKVQTTTCQKAVTEEEFQAWEEQQEIQKALEDQLYLKNVIDTTVEPPAVTVPEVRNFQAIGSATDGMMIMSGAQVGKDGKLDLTGLQDQLKSMVQKALENAGVDTSEVEHEIEEFTDQIESDDSATETSETTLSTASDLDLDSTLDPDTPLSNQLKSLKSEIESELQDEEDSDSKSPEVKIQIINAGGNQNMAPLSAEQLKMIKNHLTSMAKPESKDKGEKAENQQKSHEDIYNQLG